MVIGLEFQTSSSCDVERAGDGGLVAGKGKKGMFGGKRTKGRKPEILRAIEFALGVAGVVLLGIYAGVSLDSFAHSRVAIEEFSAQVSGPPSTEEVRPSGSFVDMSHEVQADFSLWSAKRIAAFEKSWNTKPDVPIAVLRIPKIHLEIPVFDNTGVQSLNRGAGWIPGTAAPGKNGNVGIAGHRDGFFRKLKYAARGDEIVLLTREGTETFRVDRIEIVRPEQTSVLKPRAGRSLTLVTCYPFYYVGSAPERFVVEGHLESEVQITKSLEPGPKTEVESNKNTFQGGIRK